jgi:hypothetical protein
MIKATESEPPSCSSIFMIGRDSGGNWVVRDQSGLRGGLFVGRAEALRYVGSESGSRPSAVVVINGVFDLDVSSMRQLPVLHRLNADEEEACRAA